MLSFGTRDPTLAIPKLEGSSKRRCKSRRPVWGRRKDSPALPRERKRNRKWRRQGWARDSRPGTRQGSPGSEKRGGWGKSVSLATSSPNYIFATLGKTIRADLFACFQTLDDCACLLRVRSVFRESARCTKSTNVIDLRSLRGIGFTFRIDNVAREAFRHASTPQRHPEAHAYNHGHGNHAVHHIGGRDSTKAGFGTEQLTAGTRAHHGRRTARDGRGRLALTGHLTTECAHSLCTLKSIHTDRLPEGTRFRQFRATLRFRRSTSRSFRSKRGRCPPW
jgi:hypothetical protein